jgi:hypothetical protein
MTTAVENTAGLNGHIPAGNIRNIVQDYPGLLAAGVPAQKS